MNLTPVCLVTGFLGSGKTTFLRQLTERYRDRRLVYLVNEFSSTDIDGRRLDLPSDRILSIVGGSIFCQCLVTEFIEVLRAARTFFAGDVEGVVIEASGIADPSVFGRLLEETQLDQVYALALCVTLVDPATLGKVLRTLPNAQAQVESADVVLLNKTDLHTEESLTRAETEIRTLNTHARLIRTRHARAEVDIFAQPVRPAPQGEYATCRDPNFCTSTAHPPGPIVWAKLREALVLLGDVLCRAKGFLLCDDGWRYVDWAAGEWTEEPSASNETSELVLIGHAESAQRLQRLRQRIDAGTFCR